MKATLPTFERINALTSPVARMLLTDLYEAYVDCLVIGNTLLPEDRRGKIRLDTTNDKLGQSAEKLLTLKPHEVKENREAEKAARLQQYIDDVANGEAIAFCEHEDKLYRNQITFAKLALTEEDWNEST